MFATKSNTTKIVVFGGRYFSNKRFIYMVLNSLYKQYKFTDIITGGCNGADELADKWAKQFIKNSGSEIIKRHVEKAYWHNLDVPGSWPSKCGTYNVNAGFTRNQLMLDKYNPDIAVMFKGYRGTADMFRRCKRFKKLKPSFIIVDTTNGFNHYGETNN